MKGEGCQRESNGFRTMREGCQFKEQQHIKLGRNVMENERIINKGSKISNENTPHSKKMWRIL